MTQPPDTDLATVAARSVADATAAPPDDLPATPRAYLAWLRDPGTKPTRPTCPPAGRTYLHTVPRRPAPKVRDPAYDTAAAELARLPDLGANLVDQARAELGDTTWEVLVVRAAELHHHK